MFHRSLVIVVLGLFVLPLVPFSPSVSATTSQIPAFVTVQGPSGGDQYGGEPSLGINWKTGAVFYIHSFETYRVAFGPGDASTWTDVSPVNTAFNVDPMLIADSAMGRIFTGGLDGTCSLMAFTDDDGASWTPTGNMCVPTADHQSIAAGPWKEPRPVAAIHDRATYYCGQLLAVSCTVSYDGGMTWANPSSVQCGSVTPQFHGSLHVAQNGNVFLPFRSCGGRIGMAVSQDNGLTWSPKTIPGSAYAGNGFDSDVAATPSGWVYIGYANGTKGTAMATLTKNNGTTWSSPVDIGADVGVVTSTFHETVAGDDDRAAVAFLGTTTDGDPWAEGFPGVWDLYVAMTFDAGQTWTTRKVSTDPVQRGWICDGGTLCASGRNLLDFMDAQIDATGRIYVAHADGCVDACALPSGTAAQSNGGTATISRQTAGLTLFSRFDPATGSLVASAEGPYTATIAEGAELLGLAAHGAEPYTYRWSVVTRPQGSAVDDASFSAVTSAATGFAPDVVGDYTLRFEARDANGDMAVDLARVTAVLASGSPVPPCGASVATDPAGDTTASGAGSARRDIIAVRASDDNSLATFCVEAADLSATPSGGSRFAIFFDAPWQTPAQSYAAIATIAADGNVGNAGLFRAVNGNLINAAGAAASAVVVGDQVRLSFARSAIGSPPMGASATNVFARVESTSTPSTTWDRAPNVGGATFTFGQRAPDTVAPSQVSGVSIVDPVTGSELALSWDPATDDVQLGDYVVRRADSLAGPYVTVAIVAATSHLDGGLVQSDVYYYAIHARDAAGNLGPASAIVIGTPTGVPPDSTPPSAPASLAAANVSSYSLDLVWTAATDAESGVASYHVYRDGVLLAQTSALTIEDGSLVPGTTYGYAVAAVNGEGLEGPEIGLTVSVPAVVPDCGQVAYELATDGARDATRADGRGDILRVSVHETGSRVYFHVGVRNLTSSAPATMFRIAWTTDTPLELVAYARVNDTAATATGLFLRNPVTNQEVKVFNTFVSLQCDSVLVGFQKADIEELSGSGVLHNVVVRTTPDGTGAAESQTVDRAPATGGIDYTIGSS